jgi:hypothetical protein
MFQKVRRSSAPWAGIVATELIRHGLADWPQEDNPDGSLVLTALGNSAPAAADRARGGSYVEWRRTEGWSSKWDDKEVMCLCRQETNPPYEWLYFGIRHEISTHPDYVVAWAPKPISPLWVREMTTSASDPLTGDLGSTADAGRISAHSALDVLLGNVGDAGKKTPEWTAEQRESVEALDSPEGRDAIRDALSQMETTSAARNDLLKVVGAIVAGMAMKSSHILELRWPNGERQLKSGATTATMLDDFLRAAFTPAPEPAWPPGDCKYPVLCSNEHRAKSGWIAPHSLHERERV